MGEKDISAPAANPFGENNPVNQAGTNYGTTPASSGSDDGFGVGQTQNLHPEQNTGSGGGSLEVKLSELNKIAEDRVTKTRVKDLFDKYMPSLNPDHVEKAESSIQDIVQQADHLGVRFLDYKDISDMEKSDQQKYESAIARKIKLFDFLKNKVGINPYQWQLKSRLKEAKKAKAVLEKDVKILATELEGRVSYSSRGSQFHQEVLDSLPSYVLEDNKFSSIVKYLSNESRAVSGESGLRGLYRDLGEKGRVYTDIDDMVQANIASFTDGMETAKKEIGDITAKLATEPKNKELIQGRMEINTKYSSYIKERDRWRAMQEHVVDELLGIQAEYDLAGQQIELRSGVISGTKETLRELNSSITYLENFVKVKQDVVMIGQHMMYMDKARAISQQINLGGLVAGKAAGYLMKQMTEQMKSTIREPILTAGGTQIRDANNEIQSYRRERVEGFKKRLATGNFYEG